MKGGIAMSVQREFIDLLSDNQVPVIDYSDDELATEFAAVDRLEAELSELYGALPATHPYPGYDAIRQEIHSELGERISRGEE
jgi:hypothetical protein